MKTPLRPGTFLEAPGLYVGQTGDRKQQYISSEHAIICRETRILFLWHSNESPVLQRCFLCFPSCELSLGLGWKACGAYFHLLTGGETSPSTLYLKAQFSNWGLFNRGMLFYLVERLSAPSLLVRIKKAACSGSRWPPLHPSLPGGSQKLA